jgi:hypothetical protein
VTGWHSGRQNLRFSDLIDLDARRAFGGDGCDSEVLAPIEAITAEGARWLEANTTQTRAASRSA